MQASTLPLSYDPNPGKDDSCQRIPERVTGAHAQQSLMTVSPHTELQSLSSPTPPPHTVEPPTSQGVSPASILSRLANGRPARNSLSSAT